MNIYGTKNRISRLAVQKQRLRSDEEQFYPRYYFFSSASIQVVRVLLAVFLVSTYIVPLAEKTWKYVGGLHNNINNIIFNPQ